MRPTRSLGHVAGLAASLCIVGIALEVWDGSPARTAGVELLVWCALGYGAVAIAVGVGSFLGRPDEVWSASLAALTAVLPLLAAVPVTPGIRILGPAGPDDDPAGGSERRFRRGLRHVADPHSRRQRSVSGHDRREHRRVRHHDRRA